MTQQEHLAKFNETVSILVKAYLNDTLQHGNCYACAVGNLVAACTGREFQRVNGLPRVEWAGWSIEDVEWQRVFITSTDNGRKRQHVYQEMYDGVPKRQIDSTGYSWQELARVEMAFEMVESSTDRMFNGLMAVVDVLASIHGVDLKTTEAARALFVK